MFIKIERCLRWLQRKRFRDNGLLFTRNNIGIDREIDYCDDYACVYIEVWFDAERKFGLKLGDEEYVNVYAFIKPNTGEVYVTYVINYFDGFIDDERQFTALTQAEKNLILTMANETSIAETGLSLDANWRNLITDDWLEDIKIGRRF